MESGEADVAEQLKKLNAGTSLTALVNCPHVSLSGSDSQNFNEMAERHSPLWKTFTSNVCRSAIRSVLKRVLENNLLNDLFGWSDAFTDEEKEWGEKKRNQKDKEYRKSLSSLGGRLYSSLSEQEYNIAVYYSEHGSFFSFTPDGKDDFLI